MINKQIQGAVFQKTCGYTEEGSVLSIVCTQRKPYAKLELYLETNGQEHKAGSCDKQGICSVADNTNYHLRLGYNKTSANERLMIVFIHDINRTTTRAYCYHNDDRSTAPWCKIYVYVKASKPTCEGPRFIDGNTSALITCTSERVYPGGTCDFKVKVIACDFKIKVMTCDFKVKVMTCDFYSAWVDLRARVFGGSVASVSALRCAGTLLSRVRAPPPAPWPDGGPESLRSPCCK
ncbi:hypothetical protein PoB_004037700 [Plakobranchus ocellatus]|uniref:SUEL-type lectin domain-containing protein n=1 Tax=Plakobranchus ocellatus TaxID=259542 RepID=A0AAV4B3U2_9GAST|nr:hypothetical protein PoB_004037700 [Plakobranchus ocellatus]